MNRYEREHPNRGGVEAAVNYHRNTGKMGAAWETFWYMNGLRHEMRRALLGVDKPTAWCGDRNNRLRRMIAHVRSLPAPTLPSIANTGSKS